MKSLVTGASGFVGRHLVEHLEERGDTVITSDRQTGGPDLADFEAVSALLDDIRPDAIYHLAGWADVGGSWDHPREAFEANATGTLNVLEAARAAGTRRILNVGSADVYGKVQPSDLPITEDHPLMPATPYAASKIAAEYLGVQAHVGHDMGVISVRAFNHIGPGQSDKFVGPALALRIARAERDGVAEIEVGNVEPRRDLTDVRDVVRAYRMLMTDGEPGEIYNVCSGPRPRDPGGGRAPHQPGDHPHDPRRGPGAATAGRHAGPRRKPPEADRCNRLEPGDPHRAVAARGPRRVPGAGRS